MLENRGGPSCLASREGLTCFKEMGTGAKLPGRGRKANLPFKGGLTCIGKKGELALLIKEG